MKPHTVAHDAVLCRNVYHWTKVVLIERQKQSVVPDVTIEKRKCLAPAPSGGGGKNNNLDDDVENHESEYLFLQPDQLDQRPNRSGHRSPQ